MNYPHLLSPVTIGKVTLKNRISSPDASLHLLQGPETFPADGYRAWVIQMAKSCAYLVMSPCSLSPLAPSSWSPPSTPMP